MIYMYINLRTLFLPQNYCLISLSLVEQLIYLSALQQSPKIGAQWNMIETQYIYKHTWWTTGGSCLTGQQTAESSVVVPGYMWRESGWRGPGEKTQGQDLMTEWGQGAWRHSTKKYHRVNKRLVTELLLQHISVNQFLHLHRPKWYAILIAIDEPNAKKHTDQHRI